MTISLQFHKLDSLQWPIAIVDYPARGQAPRDFRDAVKMREPQGMTKLRPVRVVCNLMNIMNTIKKILFDMLLTSFSNRQFAHSQQYSLLYDGVVVVL